VFDWQLSRELDAILVLLDLPNLSSKAWRTCKIRKAHLEWVAFCGGTRQPDPAVWEKLRVECLRRDKWTCQGCGRQGARLHAHHVIPRYRGGPDVLDNLIAVCTKCHKRIHPWIEEWE
jgi:5-methylcytosine-specific restriction endonuclease McrA